jgi:hypothetical protein
MLYKAAALKVSLDLIWFLVFLGEPFCLSDLYHISEQIETAWIRFLLLFRIWAKNLSMK